MTMRQRLLPAYVRYLLLGSAALLMFAPMPAFADAPAQDNSGNNGNTPNKPDANKAKQLGNITVTAQSRSQQMEQVPIALQIITAKQIDTLAATDLSKMSLFVPGLVVDGSQPTQPNYELRGVSTSDFGIGTEPAVGVYVDGVYAARSGGALLAFNDIDRIEVLKGPQGTLFGRNAIGGAISIVTNEPTDKFEGKVLVRIGNDGERYENALGEHSDQQRHGTARQRAATTRATAGSKTRPTASTTARTTTGVPAWCTAGTSRPTRACCCHGITSGLTSHRNRPSA